MKKIIPFFTNIYMVVLYINKEDEYCVAYSANHWFSKDRKREKLADMVKVTFKDMDSANLYLAKKIYPNIDILNGMVANYTVCDDVEESQEYAKTGTSGGGSGKQYYFVGNKNLQNHYFSFWMCRERLVRQHILKKAR